MEVLKSEDGRVITRAIGRVIGEYEQIKLDTWEIAKGIQMARENLRRVWQIRRFVPNEYPNARRLALRKRKMWRVAWEKNQAELKLWEHPIIP